MQRLENENAKVTLMIIPMQPPYTSNLESYITLITTIVVPKPIAAVFPTFSAKYADNL